MAPAAKVIKTTGVVLIFFGVIALTLGTSNEEIDAYPQYIDLVSNRNLENSLQAIIRHGLLKFG